MLSRFHAGSVYHTFSGIIFDHCQYHLKSFKNAATEVCAVYGQTCDGLDTISQSEELPDLAIDDLVYSENIGAYSNASSKWFNGFPPAQVVHVNQYKPSREFPSCTWRRIYFCFSTSRLTAEEW